jgi:hypothetical protein
MNLTRRITQAQKNLDRKRAQARRAKAAERASLRYDVYDLEDALATLKEQQKQQEAW